MFQHLFWQPMSTSFLPGCVGCWFRVCIFVTWCLINKDKLLARLETVILITYHYGYECSPATTCFSYVSLLREQLCQKMRILSPNIFLYMGPAHFLLLQKPYMMTYYLLTHILLTMSTGNEREGNCIVD